MDREIDPKERRQALVRRWAIVAGTVLVLAVAVAWGFGLLRASVRRGDIRTAVIDAGPVDASLSATGAVVPEVEMTISSPVDARVLKVLRNAGSQVKKGDPILQLDVSLSLLAVQQLREDISLKTNQQARSRLSLENRLADLNAQVEVKTLELESARLHHERSRQLSKERLISEEMLRQADVAERQAAIELKQLESARRNAEAANKAENEGLNLEMSKLEREATEARRVLDLATATADRDGVVTWTLTDEGAAVHRGDTIVRLADLRSFRVDASVSDAYASRLAVGQTVQVRVGDSSLQGRVSNILPTVQNGAITVAVSLEDHSNPLLRPNLRVEVFIVTGHRDKALRIRKGVSTGGEGYQQVFVVRGDRAVRTRVRFGIASFDYVEVVEGLNQGDEVIISDMSDHIHLPTIRVR